MTYAEIIASIQAYEKRIKAEMQIQAFIAYRQADLIAANVARVFGSKHQPISLQEAFPGIFPEETKPRQQNWQLMKERIEAYAAERRKRGEKSGNDS